MTDRSEAPTYREAFRDLVQFAKQDPRGALHLICLLLFFGPMFLAAAAYQWVSRNV